MVLVQPPAGADGRRRARDLRDVLSEQGFEPVAHGTVVRLRNCPFHSLTEEYKLPICEMNLAFQRGVIDGLEYDDTTARLTPEAGYCCVTIESNPAASDEQGSRALPRSRLRSLASAIGGLRPH